MKSKIEKGRYVNALKALVSEKGAKMNGDGGAIPSLCNCGVMCENIKQIRLQSKGSHRQESDYNAAAEPFQVCASNC